MKGERLPQNCSREKSGYGDSQLTLLRNLCNEASSCRRSQAPNSNLIATHTPASFQTSYPVH